MRISYFVLILTLLSSPVLNIHESDVINEVDLPKVIEEIVELNPQVEEEISIEFLDPANEEIEDLIIEVPIIEEKKEEIKVNISKFNVNGLNLKVGVSSDEVLRVKKFFTLMGYSDIVEDYYFDNKLKDAIIKYQKEKGLRADGVIGPDTYAKINEDLEMSKINISYEDLIFNTNIPEGYWIIINKSNNTLYYLKGKELIKKYPVATGKSPIYTPEGKFTIVSKAINPAWGGAGMYTPVRGGAPNNPLGKRWMGLSIKGGGSYGIHGNAAPNSIGTYASLGCVRMFNEDVEYLYDLIKHGTPVWIGNETKLKEFGVAYDKKSVEIYASLSSIQIY